LELEFDEESWNELRDLGVQPLGEQQKNYGDGIDHSSVIFGYSKDTMMDALWWEAMC